MFSRLVLVSIVIGALLIGRTESTAGALLKIDGSIVRWGAPSIEGPVVVTYFLLTGPYILPAGKRVMSPDNCGTMSSFATIVSEASKLPVSVARRELRSAFTAWESAASITFVEVADIRNANIVVGASSSSMGRAFANLSIGGRYGIEAVSKALGDSSHARSIEMPDSTGDGFVSLIDQAYICLNPRLRWKVGFDGDLNIYDLRHTFMHEIGHAIGLDHPASTGAIMGYRYDERAREPQPSDIEAIQSLYGMPQQK